MSYNLSIDSKAILLLTAPLLSGGGSKSVRPLTHGEYKRLAQKLRELQRKPSDFFAEDSDKLLHEVDSIVDSQRLQQLLERSFLLSQAIERLSSRAIWVVTRADANYPQMLWNRLKEDRPAVLYYCGNFDLLENGGLGVVGSRQVSEDIIEYSKNIGQQAAQAGRTIVSGSAKGVDQAAMNGALQAGGMAVGVLACNLERVVMNRENRNFIKEGRLTLISPFDPAMGFNVGNAMQRNKFIYALSDAALVVNSSLGKGGTWSGAVEQLDKLKYVPVYVRLTEEQSPGLDALREKGALPWPI